MAAAVSTAATRRVQELSIVSMDTIVTARVISEQPATTASGALQRALAWFGYVERVCSRFDPESEVYRLATKPGVRVAVSPLLFEAISFSLEVAADSDGAFDPTVGAAQALRGFDLNYLTKQHVPAPECDPTATYQDIVLEPAECTVMLRKPLLLDLGAVVKGMAIDLAAKELSGFESFSIDAGGDLYVKGKNEDGQPWRVGIEHPRTDGLIATIALEQGSICTSGDYLRQDRAGEHHILDPRKRHGPASGDSSLPFDFAQGRLAQNDKRASGQSPRDVIACSVVAPTAIAADALSTAAYVCGADRGLSLLEEQGVEGLLVRADLSLAMTSGFERMLA